MNVVFAGGVQPRLELILCVNFGHDMIILGSSSKANCLSVDPGILDPVSGNALRIGKHNDDGNQGHQGPSAPCGLSFGAPHRYREGLCSLSQSWMG